MNNLKIQAIRLQIEKIVHLDPILQSLLNSKSNHKNYSRSLFKNQLNRSYVNKNNRILNNNKDLKGFYNWRYKYKIQTIDVLWNQLIKMHKFVIKRRFRKVNVLVTYILSMQSSKKKNVEILRTSHFQISQQKYT
ncbi:unnamed protein product [Paramecium sonneborni]|uniref:Uncharacterized protein n=1 Tax=Paramecium sonneborni TaxID=65129 RepID=A0A8S1RLN3_9CILI|nr:unnamed protein product [Paramecium sonneborni]